LGDLANLVIDFGYSLALAKPNKTKESESSKNYGNVSFSTLTQTEGVI
jgi:hypothetical protein